MISVFALVLIGVFVPMMGAGAQVGLVKEAGQLTLTVDAKPFAIYVWNDPKTTRPYFKEIHAPAASVQVTRNHPPQAGDFPDHETYHPGLWWGFGDVGGNDYWRMKARVAGGDFVEEPWANGDRAGFSVRNRLLVNGGNETFCEQICRYRFFDRPDGVLVICESTFRRAAGDFWLGDQEEMGLAVRVATPIAVASENGGRILDSEGRTGLGEIRTHQSDWCDYSGPIDGKHAGILLMNDPSNFRKPWWHAVDTGLLVANPLGESELNGRGKRRQNVLVKQGEPFRLRYGAFFHSHENAADFDPAAAYQDFLKIVDTAPAEWFPERSELPRVPDGFEVSIFAGEPLIYKPTVLCFDALGRLAVGQGPQYPRNLEETPTDSVLLLIDHDGDGVADESKRFAEGFNSIQGLAWKGTDLYVANAPELTIVRDLDGDDRADEYVVVYTDLGNREHALHGLNWGPDGKLYMSKGNSKGHNQPEKYGYVAPRPFRELWDVAHPPGAPDHYPPRTFTRDTYRKTYHHWDDDWGREGGILRCDPLGANLEIVSRGMRNPWDITMDDGFNWLGTDNDQNQGDRIIMPFFGAHFGWGHRYSSHWTGENHLPTAPISGPLFPGSGAGIIYHTHRQFPAEYRNVFFINDWLHGTWVYRPVWDGALMQPAGGRWESFARRGGMVYRPTDLEFGPDGTIYICGWGGDYHYEPGSVGSWIFRVVHGGNPVASRAEWYPRHRSLPLAEWSLDQLLGDLDHDVLPVWRVNAQDELVRRGDRIRSALVDSIRSGRLDRGRETWAVWALGRMAPGDPSIDAVLGEFARPAIPARLNLRIQALRILAHRVRNRLTNGDLPDPVLSALRDPEPRVRLEAVQAIWQARQKRWVPALIDWLAEEEDRLVFYSGWGALRDLADVAFRRELLNDERAGVRLAALLGLLESHSLSADEVLAIADNDPDPRIQEYAVTWSMNPVPPKKMPNSTVRIELEQSVAVGDLMKRADAARTPTLRELYLTLLSRATYRRESEWRQVLDYYRSLEGDAERALVLKPLAREPGALPVLWEALGGDSALGRSAVHGFLSLSKRAGTTPEQVAGYLIGRLAGSSDHPIRTGRAIETLSRLSFPTPWIPPAGWDAVLSRAFDSGAEISTQSRVLDILSGVNQDELRASDLIRALLRRASGKPDARLYGGLLRLNSSLGMELTLVPPEPATIEGALALVARADPDRGRELFFGDGTAAACLSCHRLQGLGNEIAPDLSGIGSRSDPGSIIQSILDPGAVITEGYRLNEIETDSEILYGAVLRETDSEIEFATRLGELQRISIGSIVSRRTLDESSMPGNFGELLGNQQIADLTAFLMTCRHPSSEAQPARVADETKTR